jgi:asparagine synthase (glutamine-hydrolysing)
MCGIGGIIKLKKSGINLADGALKLSQTLRHRGPDDEGYLFFNEGDTLCAYADDTQKESIGNDFNFSARKPITEIPGDFIGVLMHRRLAIIDTGAAGHQPMCDDRGELWVTYNGEIYNYIELRKELEILGCVFRTNSDTEVLLYAYQRWGESCLHKLNGMFAFALWDKARKKVFCARDPSGVKPFYYYLQNGIFCFASELKALRKLEFVETQVNERAVHHYLVYDALEYEPESFLKNVFELQGSHYLSLDLSSGQHELKKYFEIDPHHTIEHTLDDAIAEVRTLLTDAIVKRLRSDVAVGCCLSGGIDSSVISGVIAQHNKNFNAFTATFPGEAIDESGYAKEVVNFTGARWHTVTPTEQDLVDDYEKMVYALDIPIWSTSTYAQFRVMRLAQENKIKVVLDGQGGDELFAGYPHYYTSYVNELMTHMQLGKAAKELRSLGNNFWMRYLRENAKRKLHYNANVHHLRKEFVRAHTPPRNMRHAFNSLNEHLHYDFFGGRLKTYLRCEDRCSMHHSVESRTPFSDDVLLIERSFALAPALKIHSGVSKFILRESMKKFLPASVYSRRDKMGFVTPHNRWLSSLIGKYPDISNSQVLRPYFQPEYLRSLNHLSAKSDHLPNKMDMKENNLAFKALTLSTWYKVFNL